MYSQDFIIIFVVMVSGIISLLSFSVVLSLAYRKAVDFCMIILHCATLLKVFISSESSDGVFRVSETLLFPSLSILAKASSTVCSRSGESGTLVLSLTLGELIS